MVNSSLFEVEKSNWGNSSSEVPVQRGKNLVDLALAVCFPILMVIIQICGMAGQTFLLRNLNRNFEGYLCSS